MKMNIILIIIGTILLVAGLAMTFTSHKETETTESDNTEVSLEPIVEVDKPEKTEISSSESDAKRKGNDFEDFIADKLSSSNLRIKEWNKGTVTESGAFGENALNPDMFVADEDNKLEYWIECKYRSSLPRDGFQVEEYQMKRYTAKQKDTRRKVLFAIGVGGRASQPDKLYLVPLDTVARYKHIPEMYLQRYMLDSGDDAAIRTHAKDYFYNKVFKPKK